MNSKNYLLANAKKGDKFRCRDGSIVTLTGIRPIANPYIHYVTPNGRGDEYGVFPDGFVEWDIHEIQNGKDLVEKIM